MCYNSPLKILQIKRMVLWTLLNTESNKFVADTLQNAKFYHRIGEGNNFLQCLEKKS